MWIFLKTVKQTRHSPVGVKLSTVSKMADKEIK